MWTGKEAVQVEKPARIKGAGSVQEVDEQMREDFREPAPLSGEWCVCFPRGSLRSCSGSLGFSPCRLPCPGKSLKASGPA